MTPLEALHTIISRYQTTCTYDALKVEDIAREGLKGAFMLIPLEQVTTMLALMSDAYEVSKGEGLAMHNALLQSFNDRLTAGAWKPMSLPTVTPYTQGTEATK